MFRVLSKAESKNRGAVASLETGREWHGSLGSFHIICSSDLRYYEFPRFFATAIENQLYPQPDSSGSWSEGGSEEAAIKTMRKGRMLSYGYCRGLPFRFTQEPFSSLPSLFVDYHLGHRFI